MAKLNLKIITPEQTLLEKEVDSVSSKTLDGYIGVLPNHIPLMTVLDIGITKYQTNSEEEYIATIGGVMQVSENNVTILTEAAELGEDIDIPRAKASKERAEARLQAKSSDVDLDRAQMALAKALARLKASSKISR